METVCENDSRGPAVPATGGQDTVGAIPPMRGVRRMNSSSQSASLGRGGPQRSVSMRATARPMAAPTKSTDAAASLRGSAVARANSSRALLRATSNNIVRPSIAAPPGRTNSAQGLRAFNRDQIVNTSIGRKSSIEGLSQMRGPGGTLQRHESDMSLDFSMGDGSLFTMDSVQLRKGQQLVADPFDDNTYDEQNSFADHESFVTRDDDNIYGILPAQTPAINFGDLAELRLNQRLHISSGDDASEASFGTMGSGLTTDFTDHDYTDYAGEETEQAE